MSISTQESCPAGTLWDDSLKLCNWAALVSCNSGPTSPSPTTTSTSKPSTTKAPAGVFVCPPGVAGNFADPSDCQKFYKCFYGVATSESCAAGLLWDDSIKNCNWAVNVVCNSAATAAPSTNPSTTTATQTTAKPATTTTTTTAASTAGGAGSCNSMLAVSSSWTGNLGATLNLPVTTSISSFSILITSDVPISNIQFWDADVTPSSGTSFTVTSKSWFSGSKAGSVLSLGLQISFSGSKNPSFTSIKLNNNELCQGTGGSQPSTTQSPVTSSITSVITPATTSPGVSSTTSTGSGNCSPKKVVCYYPNWAHYRPGLGSYKVEDIDVSLCTHIVYAFATLDGSTYTMNVFDSWLDIDLKNYEKFVGLRAQYPNKKFLIALGGWNDSRTNKYATLLASAALRANFVTKAVEFIAKYKFDGLDLDYEYPAFEQSASEKSTFAAWVKELKTAFKPYGWELTAAVAAGKSKIDAGYDVPELSKYLDAIHLMTYDMHGSWESTVNHHAPLYSTSSSDELSVDFAVNYWLSKGAPKSKLVVGIPTYGQSWTLSGSSTSIGSSGSGAGSQGSITQQAGFLSYQEICLNLKNGWTVVNDLTGSRGPYAYNGNQWVGYDDPAIAGLKAQYILDNDLGGAMFWDLPSDDFNNRCGGGRYPIISAVDKVLTPC
ncbi:acidic mammalian chitinase isoform X3 [Eurytemora carolleeae]|uniref:acidic mammalian chitinase isoform X3 n=1 Tax=Eurytemora carolleeae TaxID=1294199 RepID=UPI000C785C1F|nr:acidic mammalian chitinase isoform X3 [Eurytemora carolleeae]|eukprot:XP_023347581.1 acidic mammalian chitinase-like isoform X3 [Eurytemora affinis]